MKKIISYLIILIILLTTPFLVLAQAEDHIAREEAEGKIIWQQLQNKELICANLTDDNFASLGEFFMGQRLGNSHSAMNQMMIQMMGEEGEEQMHIVMGKRLSGCDTQASFPAGSNVWLPMINMMTGGMMGNWSNPSTLSNFNNSMMGNFSNNPMGWFGFGWIFMIIFWVLIIWGIIALINWLAKQGREEKKNQTALDILRERYAKGEIDKKEFEQKKKDLTS